MRTALDIAGWVLIVVSVVSAAQQFQILSRRRTGLRAVAGRAGLRLRGAVVGLLFGVILVTVWGGPWTGGSPILFFALAAIVAWNLATVLRSLMRQRKSRRA